MKFRYFAFCSSQEISLLPRASKRSIGVIAALCCFSLLRASGQLAEVDGNTVRLSQKRIFDLSAAPRTTSDGFELGLERILLAKLSDSLDRAAVVVQGRNHHWVGLIDVNSQRVLAVYPFLESSVIDLVFSRDGSALAVTIGGASGLRFVVCISAAGEVIPVRPSHSAGTKTSEVVSPEWSSNGEVLNCTLIEEGKAVGKAILVLRSKAVTFSRIQ